MAGWKALTATAAELAARTDERLTPHAGPRRYSPYLSSRNQELAVEQAVGLLLRDRLHADVCHSAARVVTPWLMRGYRTTNYLRHLAATVRYLPRVARIVAHPHTPEESR